MRVSEIDHVVFNVGDAEKSVAWWRDLLGLEPVRLDEWRRGGTLIGVGTQSAIARTSHHPTYEPAPPA